MRTKRDRDSLSSCHRQTSKTYHADTNAFHFSKRLERFVKLGRCISHRSEELGETIGID